MKATISARWYEKQGEIGFLWFVSGLGKKRFLWCYFKYKKRAKRFLRVCVRFSERAKRILKVFVRVGEKR